MMPLPLGSLGGFEGQFQLALFNGGPWGLWNVRSTSQTDLIGDMEFRRYTSLASKHGCTFFYVLSILTALPK